MTMLACIEYAAAFHLNGDDIDRAMIMGATRLRIEIEAGDARTFALRRRDVVVRD
jgi:hypothetical protein